MHNRFGLSISIGLLLVAGPAFGQTNSAMTFEVASVKPVPLDPAAALLAAVRDGRRLGMRVDPGRVAFTYENLKSLIGIAYKLK